MQALGKPLPGEMGVKGPQCYKQPSWLRGARALPVAFKPFPSVAWLAEDRPLMRAAL